MIEADDRCMRGNPHAMTARHLAGNTGIGIDGAIITEDYIAADQRVTGDPGSFAHRQVFGEDCRALSDVGRLGQLRTA